MYGIFTNICPKHHPNVGKYTSTMEHMGLISIGCRLGPWFLSNHKSLGIPATFIVNPWGPLVTGHDFGGNRVTNKTCDMSISNHYKHQGIRIWTLREKDGPHGLSSRCRWHQWHPMTTDPWIGWENIQ
jgi:hypothetical protein